MKALHESAPIFKSRVVGSVSGLLHDTGKLASSIYARVRKRQGGGALAVGTAVVYGLFWEYGFLRGGKAVRGLVRGKARKHRGRSAVEKARLIERRQIIPADVVSSCGRRASARGQAANRGGSE